MPTNDFIGFATGGSANVATQADYAAAPEITGGMSASSMASSKMCNKAWRQGANMAAAVGAYTVGKGFDAKDDGDLATLGGNVADAMDKGKFSAMYFSQTSGSYTAPRTGVYRITLKGGGGGGAYRNPSNGTGGGGGEGGTLIFYATLTKNTSYAYSVGAGGNGGNYNGGTPIDSTAGGATTITIGGMTYSAGGGGYAWAGTLNPAGGLGGRSFTAPANSLKIPGASGTQGMWGSTNTMGGSGGGSGGGRAYQNNSDASMTGQLGGGGAGQGTINSTNLTGGAGGDGYVLIEYAS